MPSLPAGSELAPILDYLGDLGYTELLVDPAPTPAEGGASGEARPSPGAAPAADATGRARRLEQLAVEASGCTRCRLSGGRTQVVFGVGNPDAELMLVGEAPGYHEDRQGIPFVGAAGELLTRIIKAIGMEREEVYIANVVKCRPPENRDPQPDEVEACRGYLEGQIELIRPRVLVALGRVAAQTLLGTDEGLGRLRGEWWEVLGVPARVTYHPAALLRNTRLKRPTWEDMQAVRDRLLQQ